MMNFSNLTSRLLCVLLLVFLVFLAMVYWIIDQQAKPEVAKLTSQTIIETGNEAVNGILSRVSQIDGMAVRWYIYRCSKNSPSLKLTGQIH